MFRRKQRNRRKKREKHILDVKVYSDYQSRERIQKATIYLTVLLVLGLTGFGLYRLGKFAARVFFQDNPRFAITQIDVETDGHLTRDQIINLAGLQKGRSVFSVDLQEAQRDLELDPLIEHAVVGRELPNRIHVTVTERVPLAQICVQPFGGERKSRLAPIVFYVDKHGVVMQAYALQSPRPLPALIGIRLADLRVGKPIQAPQVYGALELIKEMEMSRVGARLDIDRIDLSRTDMVTVFTRNGETVSFDPRDISTGLRRLGLILADAERSKVALSSADLTVKQNVPVTFRPLDDGKAKKL